MIVTINISTGPNVNPIVTHGTLFRRAGVSAEHSGDDAMQDDGWTDDEPNWREAAWYELAHAACYALLFVGGLLLMPGVVGGI